MLRQQGDRRVHIDALHLELREIALGERTQVGVAHGEQHTDGLGSEPAGDEEQRGGRRLVEPLCVVDEAHDRGLLSRRGENAQHGQRDEEAVRRGAAVGPLLEPECDP